MARIPEETVKEREDYFRRKSSDQMEAVDADLMRENQHSTMTINKPKIKLEITTAKNIEIVLNNRPYTFHDSKKLSKDLVKVKNRQTI